MANTFPKLRLAITLILTIAVGVLSSVFATQIMPNGNLDWSLTLKASSFYILVPTSALLVALQIIFYRGDEKVSQFSDDLYCIGYARKMKMVAMARDIREHPEKAQLMEVSKMLEDMGIKK